MVDAATHPINSLNEALALAPNGVNYPSDYSPPISFSLSTGGNRRSLASSLLA